MSERHNLKSSQSKSGDSGVKRARHACGACDVLVVVATFLFVTLSSVCAWGGSYTLQGTLLTPNETIEGGALTVHDSKIVQVGKGGAAEAGPIVEVHGVIMPGRSISMTTLPGMFFRGGSRAACSEIDRSGRKAQNTLMR
jgi:hypothetical protein